MKAKDDQFWEALAGAVSECRVADDASRDSAWRRLANLMRPWCRALAHRKGIRDEQGKCDFSDFFLGWLVQPGRLSSFDAGSGALHSWFKRALDMCYADYWRQERKVLLPRHRDIDDYAEALPARQENLELDALEARDELRHVPTSLRVAFVSIHHSVLGPLDVSEQTVFFRLFGVTYETLQTRLDEGSPREVATLLGKTAAWAYQIRSRVLKHLRNRRENA